MSQYLPSHLQYKPISLIWLENIPNNWRLLRGKQIFKIIDIRSETGEEELLSVSSKFGIVPRKDANVTMFKAQSYIGYKMCWPNDLVVNSIWAWAQGLGVSNHHGIVSSAYGVYRIKETNVVDPKFIHYLVRSSPFQWELQVRSKGIWTSRLQLTDWSFLDTPIPVPPFDEQRAIVKYLDYVDKRVKKYIRAKQKQIKLLEEMKQAIIHQAVTRGLDPTVPLKPSGVDWLSEIPHNWTIRRMKHSVKTSKSGTWGDDPTGFDDIICVRVADFDRDNFIIKEDKLTYRSIPENQREGRLLSCGDLLLEKSGGGENQSVGTVVYYDRNLTAVCSNFIDKISVENDYDPHFLVYLHSTLYSIKIPVRSIKQTTGIQNLDTHLYFNEKVAFPPLLEQTSISDFLQRTVKNFENKKNVERVCIKLVKEYQTHLIADVVTGKLDVREAASQLPDEIEELLEEPDETLEEELENGEELEEAIPEEE